MDPDRRREEPPLTGDPPQPGQPALSAAVSAAAAPLPSRSVRRPCRRWRWPNPATSPACLMILPGQRPQPGAEAGGMTVAAAVAAKSPLVRARDV